MNEELEKSEDLHSLIEIRREKLEKIRELGFDPYPHKYETTHTTEGLIKNYEEISETDTIISIAGRIRGVREHGKVQFVDIYDQSGKIQVYLKKNNLGDDLWELVNLLDIGDFTGIKGTLFKTRTGEITVQANSLTLLSKSLRPLPVVKEVEDEDEVKAYDTFTDKEARYRQRYLDLLLNPEVRNRFIIRSTILDKMREFLNNRGFIEFETPILQPLYGGATARPFTTEHHALKMKIYLRIADELYLKRLIIGGYEKVYELSKDFRNEGIDKTHYPEFTQLELYQAYADYNDMMKIFEEMVGFLAKDIFGTYNFEYQGNKISLEPPFKRLTIIKALKDKLNIDITDISEKKLLKVCKEKGFEDDTEQSYGKMIEFLIEEFIEPELIQPTFLMDYPREVSPLAKPKEDNPEFVERFEPFCCGLELGNAFTELNDPYIQRENFEKQETLKAKGDEEAQIIDEDFLTAMEYGMPPTGGLGIGVDRVTMIFTDAPSIREVILFPQLRHKKD